MEYTITKKLKAGKTFPVNQNLAGIVPMATEDEQALLTDDIKQNGLIHPIVLYKGQVVDGRCRQKACLTLSIPVEAVDLDDSLSEDDVKTYVKAVNTRRNLTKSQQAMIAGRESLKPGHTLSAEAKAWGIGRSVVANAKWLWKNYNDVAQQLFDGKVVPIGDKLTTSRVTVAYAYYKSLSENVKENIEHGFEEGTVIKTQAGKEWYYKQVKNLHDDVRVKILLAELANYKFSR